MIIGRRKITKDVFNSFQVGFLTIIYFRQQYSFLDTKHTECSLNIVFFSQEFSKVCHLSLASTLLLLVVQKRLIGATVHSHCVKNFEGLLQRYVGEGGVAVNCEKTQFFLNTLYLK